MGRMKGLETGSITGAEREKTNVLGGGERERQVKNRHETQRVQEERFCNADNKRGDGPEKGIWSMHTEDSDSNLERVSGLPWGKRFRGGRGAAG